MDCVLLTENFCRYVDLSLLNPASFQFHKKMLKYIRDKISFFIINQILLFVRFSLYRLNFYIFFFFFFFFRNVVIPFAYIRSINLFIVYRYIFYKIIKLQTILILIINLPKNPLIYLKIHIVFIHTHSIYKLQKKLNY